MRLILGLIYGFIATVMIVVGTFYKGEIVPDEFNIFWTTTIFSLVYMLCYMVFKKSIRYTADASRIIIGTIFVVSGLIKCNDTLGFSFKLEEYFAENALNLVFLNDYTLAISMFVSILETVLGLCLISRIWLKTIQTITLLMLLFFGWLTYYTASCNDAQALALEKGDMFSRGCVTDCGCFGDALRGTIGRSLKPWESFLKDFGLLVLILPTFFHKKRKKTTSSIFHLATAFVISILFGWMLFEWALPSFLILGALFCAVILAPFIYRIKRTVLSIGYILFCLIFTMYAYWNLPTKDYRAYAIGNDVFEKMNNGKAGVYEDLMIYQHNVTKKQKTFNNTSYLKNWKDIEKHYTFVSRTQKEIEPLVESSIANFKPTKPENLLTKKEKDNHLIFKYIVNGEVDFTEYLLAQPTLYWITMYKTDAVSSKNKKRLETFIEKLKRYQMPYFIISDVKCPKKWLKYKANWLTMDEVEIKIIVRSNPGIVYLNSGIIKGKWSIHNIENIEFND